MGEAARRRERIGAEMVSLIGAKSCNSCEFKLRIPQQPKILMCRRYPPQVVTMPLPPSGQWGINGFYPQVNPEWPCGEYRRNEQYAHEELQESVQGVTQQ